MFVMRDQGKTLCSFCISWKWILIFFPSMPRFSKRSLSLRFHNQKFCVHLFCSPIRATCPVHLILLSLVTRIIFCERTTLTWSNSSQYCNFLCFDIVYVSGLTPTLRGENAASSFRICNIRVQSCAEDGDYVSPKLRCNLHNNLNKNAN